MAYRRAEAVPLLPQSSYSPERKTDTAAHLRKDTELWNWIKENKDEKSVFAERKRRGTASIVNDLFVLVIWTLQVFCVLQSLGLRWPLPESWLKNTRYVFFFNLDVWEFMKLNGNGTYTSLRGYYTPSSEVGFSYWYLLVGWGALISLLFLIYVITYSVISHKRSPFMLVKIARLQRAFVVITQLLSLPFGVAIYRVFHCNSDNFVDVANEYVCFRGTHWAILAPGVTFSVVIFILFPIWLILKTKEELLSMTSDRHEGYLQLKETEYVHGLDVQWIVANFYIFSSFKKRSAHSHAAIQLLNALIIIFYASCFNEMFVGAVLVNVVLLSMLIAFLVLRPFRVTCFNVYLVLSLLCLTMGCMMGTLVTSFDSYSLQTVWLTPYYLNIVLSIIYLFWVFVTLVWIIYVVVRLIGCCNASCKAKPLWPTMSAAGLEKLSVRTREYVKSVIICKLLIEKCLTMSALFAPAHELARQIQIVNAYCREAEFLKDPLQNTLWDLLDELIEAHTKVAPKSLFAESVKESIRTTAGEFMKMMPAFKRRLYQREYDFILMSRKKRRILLKMYCMGLFLNGRREKMMRLRLTHPAVNRVWKQKKEEDIEDDGYYEDMYPELESGPTHRPDTVVSLGLLGNLDEEFDDDLALHEAEMFTQQHPITPSTHYLNLAFQQDVDFSDDDTDAAVDIDGMMDGVPSRPTTALSAAVPSSSQQGSGLLSPPPPYELPVPNRPRSAVSQMSRPRSGGSKGSRPSSARLNTRLGSGASQRSGATLDGRDQSVTPIPGQVPDNMEPEESVV